MPRRRGDLLRIPLWIAGLIGAMVLPFLPGRYDPLATTLAAAATAASFAGLLLLPVGLLWLAFPRSIAPARIGLAVGAFVVAASALAAAVGSLSAGALLLLGGVAWLMTLRRRLGTRQKEPTAISRAIAAALIVVPLAAVAARMTMIGAAGAWARTHAIGNAAEIIGDIERFRERTGAYPSALSSLWPDYHPNIVGIERYRYEPSGESYNLYFETPSANLATREIVMYNPRGTPDFSSHAFDLLRLTPEEIARQRGYFASELLPQASWRRFLFD